MGRGDGNDIIEGDQSFLEQDAATRDTINIWNLQPNEVRLWDLYAGNGHEYYIECIATHETLHFNVANADLANGRLPNLVFSQPIGSKLENSGPAMITNIPNYVNALTNDRPALLSIISGKESKLYDPIPGHYDSVPASMPVWMPGIFPRS